eukprot:3000716-Rhodomonas_salina.1
MVCAAQARHFSAPKHVKPTNFAQVPLRVLEQIGRNTHPDALLPPPQEVLEHDARNLAPLAHARPVALAQTHGGLAPEEFVGKLIHVKGQQSRTMKKPFLFPEGRNFSCCWQA